MALHPCFQYISASCLSVCLHLLATILGLYVVLSLAIIVSCPPFHYTSAAGLIVRLRLALRSKAPPLQTQPGYEIICKRCVFGAF